MNNAKKRTWTGYFLEFMMLFFAVFLGFMADNFREKISERAKEQEYIQSMMEDVEEDNINIKEVVEINSQRIIFLDELLNRCFNFSATDKERVELNQYFVQVLVHPEFIAPTELTMQQLKNAGGMRLIKSKKAINEIIRYDNKLKKIANQQLYYENYQNKAIEIGTKIFNLQKLMVTLRSPKNNLTAEDFELIVEDPLKLKELGNSVAMYKGIIEYYVKLLIELNEQGETLIQILEQEYELN